MGSIITSLLDNTDAAPESVELAAKGLNISWLLNKIGIVSEPAIKAITVAVTLLAVGLFAWIIVLIAKKWLPRLIKKITSRSKYKWDDVLLDQTFFNRLAQLLVPIVLIIGLSSIEWSGMTTINKWLSVWITFAAVRVISSLLYGINRVYELYAISRERPIKVFIQVIMIVVWCAAVLVAISIFTEKNLGVLIGGLAAFAAVLMLVFQDSILGFVAGIQLSSNHMVRIGDWIVMPSRGVDGDVIEIGLTTVKVQNWDKTITTIPTHKLVSESFTNWRGMEDSGGRRIKRSVNIDVSSIHYLTDEELKTLRKSKLLKTYIEGKIKEIDDYNANRESHLDERRLTNIGTFREYLETWLASNPDIHQGMTHMVRQLQPGPTGLPVEIYCFSAKQSWIPYENVQSDIFDHIYAVMPLFQLRAFQYSGNVAAEKTN